MTAITQDEQRRMKVHVVRGGGGLRLHVREWGRADGPPILFIHGWSQNHLCWARQYDSALAGEFRLVAYDLRGHGMSEAPLEPGHYTDGKLWADDVAAIIEELGLDQLVLVGWSYGAFVICDYVRAYGQDRIAAIDFVEGAVKLPAAIRAHLAAREIDCDDVLTAMQVPLLVTQGRADSVVMPAMAEHVLATCPTAEASWYDGTGHVPHLEDPRRFNRELAELTRHAHS
jgi:non-heme chloroperoxidase